MFTVHVRRSFRVPANRVWDAVSDFGSHHHFNPFIREIRMLGDKQTGEGAERELVLYDGSVVAQRIVDYHPGTSMVIEVVQSDLLVRHHVTEIRVRPMDDSSCVLSYRVCFRPSFGLIGLPLGFYYKVRLRSQYALVLRGLARHLGESGVDYRGLGRS